MAFAVLALLGAVPGLSLGAPPAEVQTVPDAEVPTVRVVSKGAAGLAIPACRGVVWQRFDARTSEYTPISTRPCGTMAPSLPLTDKGRSFEVDAPVRDGDVVRAVVVVGSGCATGVPFELAGCSAVVAVEGPTITVRGAKR